MVRVGRLEITFQGLRKDHICHFPRMVRSGATTATCCQYPPARIDQCRQCDPRGFFLPAMSGATTGTDHGCFTIRETMRRTTGIMTRRLGKATIQEAPHAFGHLAPKSAPKPTLVSVATAETMADINIERSKGAINRAKLCGSIRCEFLCISLSSAQVAEAWRCAKSRMKSRSERGLRPSAASSDRLFPPKPNCL